MTDKRLIRAILSYNLTCTDLLVNPDRTTTALTLLDFRSSFKKLKCALSLLIYGHQICTADATDMATPTGRFTPGST